MSFLAGEWAEDVPVANVYERVILMSLARRANNDGTNAFPSRQTIARSAMCDVKTIQRHLDALRTRRVIAQGDQQAAAYLRSDRRPTVYDLLIPHSWYSQKQLSKVNNEREEIGLEPLTPANRPDLPAPPSKTARSDKGTSRARNNAGHEHDTTTGGLSVPPCSLVDNSASPDPKDQPRGDSQSRTGGLSVPERGDSQSPESVLKDPVHESLPPSGSATTVQTACDTASLTGGRDVPSSASTATLDTADLSTPATGSAGRAATAQEPAVVDEPTERSSADSPTAQRQCDVFPRQAESDPGTRDKAAELLKGQLGTLSTGQPPSSNREKHTLVDLVTNCWAAGVPNSRIKTELSRDMGNVRMISGVWRDRLRALRDDAQTRAHGLIPPRCGNCEARDDNDPIATRKITTADGSCRHCPECHPRGQQPDRRRAQPEQTSADQRTRSEAMQHIRGYLSRRDNTRQLTNPDDL